jgi:hypothetical protein
LSRRSRSNIIACVVAGIPAVPPRHDPAVAMMLSNPNAVICLAGGPSQIEPNVGRNLTRAPFSPSPPPREERAGVRRHNVFKWFLSSNPLSPAPLRRGEGVVSFGAGAKLRPPMFRSPLWDGQTAMAHLLLIMALSLS